jgi:hypothetical protein
MNYVHIEGGNTLVFCDKDLEHVTIPEGVTTI